MRTRIVDVTPERAEKWLTKNKNNRNLSYTTVNSYVRLMLDGKWLDNGEPIAFDKEGYLRNGQHRLSAIVQSGLTIKFLIVYDLEDEACKLFDRGRPRTASDIVKMSDSIDAELCTSRIIGAVKLLAYEAGISSKLNDFEIIDYINKYSESLKIAKECAGKRALAKVININNSIFYAAFFTAVENGVTAETLQDFAEVVTSGIMQHSWQTSAITLRNDIIGRRIHVAGSGTDRIETLYCIQKAISDFVVKYKRRKTYAGQKEQIYKGF